MMSPRWPDHQRIGHRCAPPIKAPNPVFAASEAVCSATSTPTDRTDSMALFTACGSVVGGGELTSCTDSMAFSLPAGALSVVVNCRPS